jgi:hypothetical protein
MLPLYYDRIPDDLPDDTIVFHIALGEINDKLLSLEQPPLTPKERQYLAADFWDDKHGYDLAIIEELDLMLRERECRALSNWATDLLAGGSCRTAA